MASRGRPKWIGGHGRGSGYGYSHGKQRPYDLFPFLDQNSDAPKSSCLKMELPPPAKPLSNEEIQLIWIKRKLEIFWKDSCYHLEEERTKSNIQDVEIERYSDRFKEKTKRKREALIFYLRLTPSNFPVELTQGSKRVQQQDYKKLRWDRDSGGRLDKLEKLEEKSKGSDRADDNEKKDEDEEDEEEVEEEAKEESEDDYNQNEYFDDDEDDFNMEEEEAEDCYE